NQRRPTEKTVSRAPESEPKGRVLPFRRPGAIPNQHVPPAPPDLAKFERLADEPDDYRHRMTMNVFAFAATVGLMLVAIWLTDVISHMRRDQDCVLTGRSGCAP